MSVFIAPAININGLKNLKETKEYLRDLNKKIRFLSENVDRDNFSNEEYIKLYENKTNAVKLKSNIDELVLSVNKFTDDKFAKLQQTAREIDLLVKKGNVTQQINISPEKVYINGNKLKVKSDNFNLDLNGNLSIKGIIDATGGNFGGFHIKKAGSKEYLEGGTGTRIDACDLSGTKIKTNKLTISTDRYISGCDINLEKCHIDSSKKTYLGWFYSDTDVHVSDVLFTLCGHVHNSVYCTGLASFYDVWSESEGMAYSDLRLKENIEYIDNEKALEFVLKLKPISYYIKDDNSIAYGLVAQDVLDIGDEFNIVRTNEDGYYSIEYGTLDAVISAALKAQLKKMRKLNVCI